jgi:O-methyltransferase involved in polyketide biosynthesis
MTQKISIAPGSLEEAMMRPLYARAWCAERYGSLFPDPGAQQAVKRADYDVSHLRVKEMGALPEALRTRIVSDQIRAFLTHHANGTVVDLSAGTDNFFAAVDNGTCTWVDIDHEDALAARARLMPAGPRQQTVAASLFDPQWFDAVEADPRQGLLFVANDVFSWYKPAAVELLCTTLAQEFPGCQIVFDASSAGTMKRANKAARKTGAAEMKFAVNDVDALRRWSPQITEAADVSQVPGDILASHALSLPVRMMLFSGGSTGLSKVVRLQARFAQ